MSTQADVDQFWTNARIEGKLNRLEVLTGQDPHGTVPPPMWASSPDPAQADTDLATLLASGQLTLAAPQADYDTEDMALPAVGDLGIVLDGSDRPRALVRTAEITVVAEHPEVPAAAGQVVVERFELLYPRRAKRRVRETTS